MLVVPSSNSTRRLNIGTGAATITARARSISLGVPREERLDAPCAVRAEAGDRTETWTTHVGASHCCLQLRFGVDNRSCLRQDVLLSAARGATLLRGHLTN